MSFESTSADPKASHKIRLLLRSKKSFQYFKNGEWTLDVEQATNFPDILHVVQAFARYGLSEVELVLRTDRVEGDILCVPMH